MRPILIGAFLGVVLFGVSVSIGVLERADGQQLPTQRTRMKAQAVASTPKVTVSTSGRIVTLTVDPGDAPIVVENPDDDGQVIGQVATATEIMRTKCYPCHNGTRKDGGFGIDDSIMKGEAISGLSDPASAQIIDQVIFNQSMPKRMGATALNPAIDGPLSDVEYRTVRAWLAPAFQAAVDNFKSSQKRK